MTCASCANRIERGLKKVGGVEVAQVNLASEQATITYDRQQVRPADFVQAVENAGYGVISDRIEFPVTGMTCGSYQGRVEKALRKVEGVIGIADPVKATSAAAIAELKRIGLRVVMLTGDNRRTASLPPCASG